MGKHVDWLSNENRFRELFNSVIETDEVRVNTFLEKVKDLGSPSLTEFSDLLCVVNTDLRYSTDLSSGTVISAIDRLENYGVWKVSYENFNDVLDRLSSYSGIEF